MDQFVQRKTLLGMLLAALMCIALLGIAAPQEAYADQGWNSDSKGWWYQYDGNSKHYYKNGWKKIGAGWYYFQKNGYAKHGWLKDGKYWYYLADSVDLGGLDARPPVMLASSFLQTNGKWYYLDKSGHMATGWCQTHEPVLDSYTWVYANKSGALVHGWKKIGSKWYHLGWPGEASNSHAYFSAIQSWGSSWGTVGGWATIGNADYYFDKNAAMVTGWQKIDGKWYYFAKSGAMQKNKWVGNYWLGSDGVMATNAWVDNDKYYVDGNGKWVKGKKK